MHTAIQRFLSGVDLHKDTKQTHEGIVRLTAKDVISLFLRHNPLMHTSVSLYHRHRFPAEIISHCVWLYFPLGFRDVEEMLAMRGASISYETVY